MQEYIWGSGTVEGNLQSESFIRAGFKIESIITGTISITSNEGLAAADMKVGIVRSRFKLALPDSLLTKELKLLTRSRDSKNSFQASPTRSINGHGAKQAL
jgi:hypothetical protein